MRKRTKYLLAGGVALALAGTAWGMFAARRNKVTEVRIETVRPRDLVASVTASGQVRPHTRVDVSSDITGRITRLAVKEGDVVRQGQFLLEIDPSQYRAAVERAVAAVAASQAQEAQAHANLLQAQRNYDRIAELKRRNPALVADEQLEQLRTAVSVNQALLESARFNVDQARASLRDARSSLAKTEIVAPISGRVTRLNVEQGETAIMGTLNKEAATLLTISDMSDLETPVKVDETDVSRITIGDTAVVQLDAFPDTTFRGRVTEISHSSTKGTGISATTTDQAVDYEVTVRLLSVPPETRPDFSATARIITDTRTHVLAVPIIALTVRADTSGRTGGARLGAEQAGDSAVTYGREVAHPAGTRDVEGVFVVGANNTVTFRPVRVGIAGEQYFEVLSGVRQGERVVSGPLQTIRTLQNGTTVRQMRTETTGDATK